MFIFRANIGIEADSFHKELKYGFYFVMMFHDYQVHIRRLTIRQNCRTTDNMPLFHRQYVEWPIYFIGYGQITQKLK